MYIAYIRNIQSEVSMIYGKLRKVGNSVVITVPREELERKNLSVGQTVAFDVQPVNITPALSKELQEFLEATWERDEAAYRYLAGR